jgi:hypothetical protein
MRGSFPWGTERAAVSQSVGGVNVVAFPSEFKGQRCQH